jgi:hypothetical protein
LAGTIFLFTHIKEQQKTRRKIKKQYHTSTERYINQSGTTNDLAILDRLGEEESKCGEADLLFAPAQRLVQNARLWSASDQSNFKF